MRLSMVWVQLRKPPGSTNVAGPVRLRPEFRCGLSRQTHGAERVSGSRGAKPVFPSPLRNLALAPQPGKPDKADYGERCIILRAERTLVTKLGRARHHRSPWPALAGVATPACRSL